MLQGFLHTCRSCAKLDDVLLKDMLLPVGQAWPLGPQADRPRPRGVAEAMEMPVALHTVSGEPDANRQSGAVCVCARAPARPPGLLTADAALRARGATRTRIEHCPKRVRDGPSAPRRWGYLQSSLTPLSLRSVIDHLASAMKYIVSPTPAFVRTPCWRSERWGARIVADEPRCPCEFPNGQASGRPWTTWGAPTALGGSRGGRSGHA